MKRSEQTRHRILECARDLFYRQGYQATTVDQVIAITGISKPTVYKYFPSKEVLAVAYLNQRKADELGDLRERLAAAKDPRRRFMGVIEFIKESLPVRNFRGCGFFNMLSEIPQRESPVVRTTLAYIDEIRDIIREVTEDLKREDPASANIDVEETAMDYYLACCGAIMASQELHQIEPAERALVNVRKLLPAKP